MLRLQVATSPRWSSTVLADFDGFLVDHAACERKASATGMSFVVRYPDRTALLEPLIAFALEELEHYQQVVARVLARGLALRPDEPDPYVGAILRLARNGRDARLLDRLLIAAVVEARGCERFGLVRDALPPGDMKDFYDDITKSEARHHGLFVRLAGHYFGETEIACRLETLLAEEGKIVTALPLRAALH